MAKAIFDMWGGRRMAERVVEQLPSQGLVVRLPDRSMSGPIGGWVHVEGDAEAIAEAARKLGRHLVEFPFIES